MWFEKEVKKYRLASPEESAEVKPVEEKDRPSLDSIYGIVNGVAVSKISVTGQVAIPAVIRKRMDFKPGDLLAFVINNDILEVRKARIKIEVE